MNDKLNVPNAPAIPGLSFRRFRGEADYPHIAALINAGNIAFHLDECITAEAVAINYRHIEHCDPATDMIFAEVEGRPIGYGRIWWFDQNDGIRLYELIGYLHPDWHGKGIGSALWTAAEARAREIAAGHPKGPKFFQAGAKDKEASRIALLEKFGYLPVRYGTGMSRDLSEPFPEAPLPEGIEVRPVKPEHLRLIWDATVEAFRDHWGVHDPSEEEYARFQEEPIYNPDLWMVAWEGDQVVSAVHNFINKEENEKFQRARGYTEDIMTRRPWRKRGIARSLLVRSMKMFKEIGMTETHLGVDSQNLSGAFRLYESVGYRKVDQQILYRKPME